MIVGAGSKQHSSDETCDHCDHVFATDGEFAMHTCPECGKTTTPCNACPHFDGRHYMPCDKCPAKDKIAHEPALN